MSFIYYSIPRTGNFIGIFFAFHYKLSSLTKNQFMYNFDMLYFIKKQGLVKPIGCQQETLSKMQTR